MNSNSLNSVNMLSSNLTYNTDISKLLPCEMTVEDSLKSLELFFSNSPVQIPLQQVANGLVILEKVYHNSEVTRRYWNVVNDPNKCKRDTSVLKQIYEMFGGNGRYSSVLYS